jgi:tetratricopeptide (TPR) repeat protein
VSDDDVQRGFDKLDCEDLAAAISHFEAALHRDRAEDRAWFGLGLAKYQVGKNVEAADAFSWCIAIGKAGRGMAAAFAMRGMTRLRLGDCEGGMADIQNAVARDPMIGDYFRYELRTGSTIPLVLLAAHNERATLIVERLAHRIAAQSSGARSDEQSH